MILVTVITEVKNTYTENWKIDLLDNYLAVTTIVLFNADVLFESK